MHLSATSLTGTDVRNPQGEDLGKIEDLMVDTNTGKVDYAVVSLWRLSRRWRQAVCRTDSGIQCRYR